MRSITLIQPAPSRLKLTTAVLLIAAQATACSRSVDPPLEATPASQARRLVVEGRALLATRKPQDLIASRDLFEKAIALDANAPDAWASAANASALIGLYSLSPPQETMPKALEAAKRALDLDPDQSTTWASLGLVQYLYSWDFKTAEQSFQRALELDPGAGGVRHWYAMMLSALARHSEAIAQIERAVELEPDSRLLNTKLGTVLSAANRLERAERVLTAAEQRFEGYSLIGREIGFLRLRQHRYDDAVTAFRGALRGTGANQDWRTSGNSKTIGALAHALAAGGDLAGALDLAELLATRRNTEYVPAMVIAHAYAGLAHADGSYSSRAFGELERALSDRDPGLVYLYTKAGFSRLDPEQLDSVAQRIFGVARDRSP